MCPSIEEAANPEITAHNIIDPNLLMTSDIDRIQANTLS
jgi:hypothetical protein